VLAREIAHPLAMNTGKWIARLPLIQPITCDTAYSGGIEIIM
jgi:hypothetical protein